MVALSASGRVNLGVSVSMLIVGVVAPTIRFIIRITRGSGSITPSDWLLSAALEFMIVYEALWINYITAGPGTLNLSELPLDHSQSEMIWAEKLFKTYYIAELFYVLSVAGIKLSVLAFYHEIFGISIKFRRWNQGVGAVCILWLIAIFLINLIRCTPVQMFWQTLDSSSSCRIHFSQAILGTEVTNLFTDILILSLPLFMIRKLNLKRSHKISLGAVFLFGGLVCITSIIKIAYAQTFSSTNNPSTSDSITNQNALSSIHLGVAFLSACLPTYRAFYMCSKHASTIYDGATEPMNRPPFSPSPEISQIKRDESGYHQHQRSLSATAPPNFFTKFPADSRPSLKPKLSITTPSSTYSRIPSEASSSYQNPSGPEQEGPVRDQSLDLQTPEHQIKSLQPVNPYEKAVSQMDYLTLPEIHAVPSRSGTKASSIYSRRTDDGDKLDLPDDRVIPSRTRTGASSVYSRHTNGVVNEDTYYLPQLRIEQDEFEDLKWQLKRGKSKLGRNENWARMYDSRVYEALDEV